jgi:hypothetical protein
LPDGEYTLRVLLQDAKLGTRPYVVVVNVNNGNESPQQDLTPAVQIQNPIAESAVSGSLQIVGTAGSFDLQEFVVEVGAGINPTEWTPSARRTTPVANSRLATWDTTSVEDGIYSIRVTVRDRVYGDAQAQMFVIVRNDEGN